MVNLERLYAFVMFSEHLSFTRAAAELHISQPALHAQIAKLSEDLGVPLYERRGRRLVLTPAGERAVGFGREMIERSDAFTRDLGGDVPFGPVVLAAGEGAFLYLLGESIRGFRRASTAPLRLLTVDRDAAIDAVHSGRAHVGVTAGELPSHELAAHPWLTVGQQLVMPTRHPLARKKRVCLRDLEGAELVVPPPEREHRRALAEALRHAGVTWTVAVEARGWQLMLHFVRLGLGLAIVNSSCHVPRGLVARPIPELPIRPYWILHRRTLSATGPAAELVELVRQSRPSVT